MNWLAHQMGEWHTCVIVVCMREFVYLSDRKLAQFMPERSAWWRRGVVKAELTVAPISIGWESTKAEPDEVRIQKLRKVVRHVERSAKWYEEPDLKPGQWIFFEADLGYSEFEDPESEWLGDRYSRSAVIFANYDSGSSRLLLHGSARHLVAGKPHEGVQFDHYSRFSGDLTPLLEYRAASMGSAELSLDVARPSSQYGQVVNHDLALECLKMLRVQYTAGAMSGYARVTADAHGKGVIASPLFVENVAN